MTHHEVSALHKQPESDIKKCSNLNLHEYVKTSCTKQENKMCL